jgi:hypothetical protein
MKSTLSVVFAAIAIMLLTVQTAGAFGGRSGGGCTGCHSDGKGNENPNPNPLEILKGGSGVMSFNVTDMGGMSDIKLAVQGLDNPLLALSVGSGGSSWVFSQRTSSPASTAYQSSILTSLQTLTMPILIGAGATPGTYPITVYLAGTGPSGGSKIFDLTILAPPVPEPATLSLTALGAIGWVLRRRRS